MLGGTLSIDARIFSIETSEILATVRVSDRLDRLFDMVLELGEKITAAADLEPLEGRPSEDPPAPEVPADAMNMFGIIEMAVERGELEHAQTLFNNFVDRFPTLTTERAVLKQQIDARR